MTPAQFARLAEIFEQAVQRPPGERLAFVRAATDDPELVHKLEAMLASEAGAFALDVPALGAGFHVADPASVERRLTAELSAEGRFEVVAKLGEGGFGAVYRVEQLRPVRRTVALKVIKLGMDTQRVVARFELERQTLAGMDHPAIARVYEAGALPSGRPYFAMEFVSGVPITEFCRARGLGVHERLRLFRQVCNAVQHAHQRGVLHRDLKPSNVLVGEADGHPMPKVIDFGIARAIGANADQSVEQAPLTQSGHGHPLGTPAYMSPEQAAGDPDIDTRTDVYSLGVLLFQLLTGSHPFERELSSGASGADLLRAIRELEPERPSQRVSSRRAGPGAADAPPIPAAALRGDLDWIVAMATEKQRARRYDSVAALAEDIDRHLASEPIRAHPPTLGYRFGKFARRNKAGLAAAGLVAMALVGTSVGLARSLKAEARARTEARIAGEINTFLNDDLLAAVAPDQLGSDVKVREVLELASRSIEGRFERDPEVEAGIRLTLGRTFARLAVLDQASRHLQRAYDLLLALRGPEAPRTLEAVHEIGELKTLLEQYADSEAWLRRALEGRTRVLGRDHLDALRSQLALGVALGEQERYAEAEPLFSDALERSTRVLGPMHKQTLAILRSLAVLNRSMGQIEKSLGLFEQAYERSRESLGVNDPTTLLAMQGLSGVLNAKGDRQRALALLSEVLEVSRSVRGPTHPATLVTMLNLGRLYGTLGDGARAEELMVGARDAARLSLPPGHTVTSRMELALADLYASQSRFELAEPLLAGAAANLRERLGAEHPLAKDASTRLESVRRARETGAPAAPR